MKKKRQFFKYALLAFVFPGALLCFVGYLVALLFCKFILGQPFDKAGPALANSMDNKAVFMTLSLLFWGSLVALLLLAWPGWLR